MVVAVRISPPAKGKVPKLSMLELVSVANSTYTISKLRKRIVAPGFCYVCSRIDPSGIFRKPNSHLYRKGFFQTCEHFPQAPYTTFVRDQVAINEDDGGESLNEFPTNKTETISVTIRKGSRSTKFPSPLKRESTFDSHVSKLDQDQRSSRESLLRSKVSSYTTEKLNLPAIVRESEGGLSTRSLTKTTKRSELRKTSGVLTGLSKKSLMQSETLPSERELESVTTNPVERVTYIPTGFDQASAISGLSTFSQGTTPSKSTNDLDAKFESESATLEQSLTSKHSVTTKNVSASKSSKTSDLLTALSGSYKNAFLPEPLENREEFREPVRRPKARLHRERILPDKQFAPSEGKSASSYRPESGHLRYHHRMDDDSVPDPGFEIPPTPSEDLLELEQLRLDQENISDSSSSKEILTNSVSDDASLAFSQKTTKSTRSSRIPSDRRSFCRCATDIREISFSRDVCRSCGKACCIEGSIRKGTDSSQMQSRQDYDTYTSSRNKSSGTRHRVLQRDEARFNIRSKPFTDEDYMDIDSIIHEDDGRYWSSDDEFGVLEHSPTSWYRYKHAQPYPLVNPDIHKLVYIEALQAAKMKGKKKVEDFQIDELKLLRRPNVFSYLSLLPYKDRKNTKYIGIRPDDSSKPKKGQLMRHIFGDIRPENFYPKAMSREHGRIIVDASSNISSSEHSSEKTDTTRTELQAVPKDPERSSVSLKMRKQGLSFDDVQNM